MYEALNYVNVAVNELYKIAFVTEEAEEKTKEFTELAWTGIMNGYLDQGYSQSEAAQGTIFQTNVTFVRSLSVSFHVAVCFCRRA